MPVLHSKIMLRRNFLKVITATTGAMVFDPLRFFKDINLIEPELSNICHVATQINEGDIAKLSKKQFYQRYYTPILSALRRHVEKLMKTERLYLIKPIGFAECYDPFQDCEIHRFDAFLGKKWSLYRA